MRSHIQAASEGRDCRGHTPNADDHRNVPGICRDLSYHRGYNLAQNVCNLPSGKHTKSYRKWPIEIDGLPIKNGDFPIRYVKVPCRVCDLGLKPTPNGMKR